MEESPLNTKTHHIHARSNSLPCKTHPMILQCNEHFAKLGCAFDATTTSSSSFLRNKLICLQDLHDSVENLVQLPLIQEALVQEHQENWVDELLEGSLRLLDTCTSTKDALLHTKECTRELQSMIRRRCGEVELIAEAKKFLNSRKVVRKAIFKALENLKCDASKCRISVTNKDYQTLSSVNLLKEVELMTFSIFESLLNFISGSMQSRRGSLSLVSKLMNSKRVSNAERLVENEFAKVDSALQLFAFNTANKSNEINDLQDKLVKLGSCMLELEEGLESLFRRLIKIRVALLNILNH